MNKNRRGWKSEIKTKSTENTRLGRLIFQVKVYEPVLNGNKISSLTINTFAHEDCVLSPLPYSIPIPVWLSTAPVPSINPPTKPPTMPSG